MVSISCCKDCKERQVGCHGTCEKYIAEKEAVSNEKRIQNKNRNEYYAVSSTLNSIKHSARRH